MSGEILKRKTVEVTMVLDGKEYRHVEIIAEGKAKNQWITCERIGNIVAKTILYNTDIKDQFQEQVL